MIPVLCAVFRRVGYYVITTSCVQRNTPRDQNNTVRFKFLVLIAIATTVLILGFLLSNQTRTNLSAQTQQTNPSLTVNIAMSASRPGCEKTGCYLPETLTVRNGDTVTWVNGDRGFHTITTGFYDTPDGVVQSEQIAASDSFSYKFTKTGQFHYYCRLHPWMEGIVIVS